MLKINLPEETIQALIEDYQNPEIRVQDLPKKYGIASGTVSNILKEYGVSLRRPKSSKSKGAKTCPHCHKKVEIKGAKYCPYCAADLRDEKELLADKLYKFLGYNSFMPANVRDEYIEIMNKTIKILNEE